MSKFFVGQRVREVRHPTRSLLCGRQPIPVGAEGVVTSIGPILFGDRCHDGATAMGDADCTVSYSGDDRLAEFYTIEPIVPDGHRSGDYSYTELMDCLKAGEVECV